MRTNKRPTSRLVVFMNELVFILVCLFVLPVSAAENDEKIKKQVQEAMAHARKNTKQGPKTSEDWLKLTDSAMKLVTPVQSKPNEVEEDESDGIMGLLEDFFK